MNVSQPISSTVAAVEFTFLTASEVRAISVKRIENDNTFDNLLNPVPGGLYDPCLGSWGNSICATCNLNHASCPGHPGHIELPVPVYHPVFMSQVVHLLRAQCIYCKGLRMKHGEVHAFSCKLRLLQHGLINAARLIDAIGEDLCGMRVEGLSDDSQAEEEDTDNILRRREQFVRRHLRSAGTRMADLRKGKHEGALEMRREVIKEFMAKVTKVRTCDTCSGISPTYRKDGAVKIFEKALSEKDAAKMAQRNLKAKDAMATAGKKKPEEKMVNGHQDDEDVIMAEPESSSDSDSGIDANGVDSDAEPLSKEAPAAESRQRYLSTMEVRERLNLLFHKEQDILSLVYSSKPLKKAGEVTADIFFLRTILVPPNRFRPEARTGNNQITEAQQNTLYKNILRSCGDFARIHQSIGRDDGPMRRKSVVDLHRAWTELQNAVNSLIDRDKNPILGAAAKRNEEGIKQKLEKKEGLFRKNMMGKRVNFAARSVISPDPNIETNEVGVPPVFARKLTYPEPVTSHNFRDMQQAVINGMEKWPGAAAIESENGQITNLRSKSADERVSLANQLLSPANADTRGMNKKVYRHLTNGDVVLMNRQPTLHKPSMMGHRVRVLPGEKTIRLHYTNCNSYNADFDGDEMNMHFPQNEIARAEALQIADTDHQYVSGTAGKPLRGLIQDHLSVSVALCARDTFFNRSDYHQLIYAALRPESGHIYGERIKLAPPAILKPVPRWTGKQVITTILQNIKPPNGGGIWTSGKCQIPAKRWGPNSEEGTVLFQDGQFLHGILDKGHLGPSTGGLVHAVHEVYGPAVAGKFLSSLGRLLTRYLGMRAFSCGMDDLKLTPDGERVRREKLSTASGIGLKVAAEYVSLEEGDCSPTDPELLVRLEEVFRDDSKLHGLDLLTNARSKDVSTAVSDSCLPNGLVKQFPKNQMQTMTVSGAKGGAVNANLISCNLGQQVLEGRRVPTMVSGKTLPCFRPFQPDLRAGGYIVDRFLTGIRPQEYYFHHMAGREGLIDTAVKTSRSGYLQRCIIKGMEGLTVSYDSTIRDADGTLVQFLYGEDGLDVTSQKYLHDFSFVLRNIDSESAQLGFGSSLKQGIADDKDDILRHMKSAIKHSKLNRPVSKDPINSLVNPSKVPFATSEKFYEQMTQYIKDNADGLIRKKGEENTGVFPNVPVSRKMAELVFAIKYMRSFVQPGESVGIVAGQSIGEPSTQMTLNTFHLAGHSAKNVTLGIPRLREILMTASKVISTPAMTLFPNEEMSQADCEVLTKSISRLPLSDIVDSATVTERAGKLPDGTLQRFYDIRLDFFPSEEYTKTYAIQLGDVKLAVSTRFLDVLMKSIHREIRKKKLEKKVDPLSIGTSAGTVEMASSGAAQEPAGDDDMDDDDGGDGDATNAKQRSNRKEEVSYESNEEDLEIQKRMARDASPDADGGDDDKAEGGEGGEGAGDAAETQEENADDAAENVDIRHKDISQFRWDDKAGAWCEFTAEFDPDTPKLLILELVQEAVRKTVVREIKGIKGCLLVPDFSVKDPVTGEERKILAIQTTGANIKKIQSFSDYVNPNKTQTNDIASVLEHYGVEACRANVVSELDAVFSGHGISVDKRHLSLIADYMTRNGGYTPFNRMGLQGNVSPFTKMSFETTLAFLKDAALDHDWDDLSTPSGRLVMGRMSKVGTGAFDVLSKLPTRHTAAVSG